MLYKTNKFRDTYEFIVPDTRKSLTYWNEILPKFVDHNGKLKIGVFLNTFYVS